MCTWPRSAALCFGLVVLMKAFSFACCDEPSYPKGGKLESCSATQDILLEWWLPVECDFSGFFVEMLGYLVPMMRRVEKLFLHLGPCSNETLGLLTAQEADVLRRALANWQEKDRVFTAESEREMGRTVLIQHATPCEWQHFGDIRPQVVIGRTMTERHGIEPRWLECFSRVDEIWVPTAWAVDIFADAGVPREQVFVMPEGVDMQLFQPKPRRSVSRKKNQRRPFVFLSVFKWEGRKGMDLLLDAYWTAFTREDNVVLRLRTYVPQWERQRNVTKELERLAKTSSRNRKRAWSARRSDPMPSALSGLAPVEVIGGGTSSEEGALSREAMRDMYAGADSFVLPTRGEGWGLPVVEAMAMGLPVIVTNHSGPASYMTPDNAYPIRCSVVRPFKVVKRGSLVTKGCLHLGRSQAATPVGGLTEPDFRHLLELMEHVSRNPVEAQAKGLRARQDVAASLSSEAVSDQMLQRMRTLLARKQEENNKVT